MWEFGLQLFVADMFYFLFANINNIKYHNIKYHKLQFK